MTRNEAVAAADLARPNELEPELKLGWLEALDGQIRQQLIDAHEGAPEPPAAQTLLVPPPWDGLYVSWLCMRIDLEQGEITRYNNEARLFEAAWQQFAGHYARTHAPKGAAALRF